MGSDINQEQRSRSSSLALRILIALLAILLAAASAMSQEIPEGVVYKPAPESVNAAAKLALEKALPLDSLSPELSGDVTVCGPMLWKSLKPSADKVLLNAKSVMAMITDPEVIHAEGKRLLSADERQSFWTAWRNKYPKLKTASIRKARADELSFYWATIPFDIEEPFFVLDTAAERFVVQLLNKQGKISLFWIDLVGDLRSLKSK
jgi:hypothetical protein